MLHLFFDELKATMECRLAHVEDCLLSLNSMVGEVSDTIAKTCGDVSLGLRTVRLHGQTAEKGQ
ncbi:hypothetical protein Syun_004234 [Stephania yunnanensis]|uniref:Uncharacterized protein n=1 Tax=Stephania yunnanensis TaxID=152371 RepID=A0AAP0L2N1_9MAGN